jgi:hypothetical protein
MRAAGIHTVQSPAEIGHTMAAALGKSKSKSGAKKKADAEKSKRATKKRK